MIASGRIDCHVHFYPPVFADELLGAEGVGGNPMGRAMLAAKPEWRDIGKLQQVMDEAGVGLGVIIPPAGMIERLRPFGANATERFNQSMSSELDKTDGRFWAAAVIDPTGSSDEVAQLDRSLSL